MSLGPEDRFRVALAKRALEDLREGGLALMLDDSILAIGRDTGLPDHLINHVGDKLEAQSLVVETSPSVYDTAPLALWYEALFEREAWREANQLRRAVLLDLANRFEAGEPHSTYKAADSPFGDVPMIAVMGALVALEWQGYVRTHHLHSRYLIANIESAGYDVARDEEELARTFPTTASEDEQAHAPVVADVLSELITSCEELLRERRWMTAAAELGRADRAYQDGNWPNAVGHYYAAVESALKHRLAEVDVSYKPTAALRDLARTAVQNGVIPANYQGLFGFLDSIRSPYRHGEGPDREREQTELGRGEALLMGNHARSLIVYLGHRPA